MTAIDALESDQATKVITILSKPPGAATAERLMDRLLRCSKPVVVCLLGSDAAHSARNVRSAATIDEAVAAALQAAGIAAPAERRPETGSLAEMAAAELAKMRPGQRFIRGLFAGGTFCYQTQAVFRKAGLVACSNSPLPGMRELADPRKSRGNSLVDMGAEVFVEGRPHPMIDATLRRQRLAQEGDDPTVAIVLLDFILGAISSRDPVGDLLPTIRGVQDAARGRGNHLCVVASVCGTNEDAQGLQSQVRALVGCRSHRFFQQRSGSGLLQGSGAAACETRGGGLMPRKLGELLKEKPVFVNVGVRDFGTSLQEAGYDVVNVDWSPPAGGDPGLAALLDDLL